MAPRILNLCIRWRWLVSPPYPLDRRLGAFHSWARGGGLKKRISSLPLLGIETRSSSPWPSQ